MTAPFLIGGSDVAAICGQNPWESSFAAWLRLTSKTPRFNGNTMTEWGHRLERSVLEKYAEVNSCVLRRGLPYGTPGASTIKDNWKRGTEDAFIVDADGNRLYGVDAKCTSAFLAKEWKDDQVPAQYLLQCVWYMHVFDLPRWDLAVLIGGNTYKQFVVMRDAALETALVDQVTEWRERFLVRGEQPPVECDEKTESWIGANLPRVAVKADEHLNELIGNYKRIWHAVKEADKMLEKARSSVIEHLAVVQADEVESQWGVVKYRAQKRKTTKWEAVVADVQRDMNISLAPFIEEHTSYTDMRVFAAPRSWSNEQ